LAWFYMTGSWPENQIDHKNLNKTDNRWSNLRLANNAQNGYNRNKQKNNKSGHKGVCWFKRTQKWHAQLKINGVRVHLGYFSKLEDAVNAYEQAALERDKDFFRR